MNRMDMEAFLEKYPPRDEDKELDSRTEERGGSRGLKKRRMKPQASLDLHGFTAAEAAERLEWFIRDSKSRGLQKVLVIHGKGHHSQGEPVLKKTVRTILEQSSICGEIGTPERTQGGPGATWVLIR